MSEAKTNDPKAATARKRRSFLGNRRGSVSIEFGMLAIPFTMLVMAILETSISFTAQQIMANATDDLARELRTGQIKKADVTAPIIHDRICDRLSILVADDCPGLFIDLQSYATFAAAAAVQVHMTPDNDLDTSGFKIDPGLSQSKNMLRVFYKWPVMLDLMRKSMSNIKGGKTLLFSTTTWQNEPFDD